MVFIPLSQLKVNCSMGYSIYYGGIRVFYSGTPVDSLRCGSSLWLNSKGLVGHGVSCVLGM